MLQCLHNTKGGKDMNSELRKTIETNTLNTVRVLTEYDEKVSSELPENFAKEVVKVLADNYNIKGMFADCQPNEVLETVSIEDMIQHLRDQGYEVN